MITYFGAGNVSSPKPVWTFRLRVAVCAGVKGRNSIIPVLVRLKSCVVLPVASQGLWSRRS